VTITSTQVTPSVDKADVDRRPGSSDIKWAEQAYHHQRGNRRPRGVGCPEPVGVDLGFSWRRSPLSS